MRARWRNAACAAATFAGAALPRLERSRLQRAAVGERQRPRSAAQLVHRIQMRGGDLVALAAGEERDAGTAAGTVRFSTASVRSATSSTDACCVQPLPEITMRGLEHRSSRTRHAGWQSAANCSRKVHSVTSSQRSIVWSPSMSTSGSTIGTIPARLADRGVARERVRVRCRCRRRAGNVRADGDHGAPLREFRAQLDVLGAAFGQTVEAFGYQFTRAERQVFRAGIHLDARNHALLFEELAKRRAVGRFLAQRFVEQNRAADVLADPLVVNSMSR